jgi:hypothetical protein
MIAFSDRQRCIQRRKDEGEEQERKAVDSLGTSVDVGGRRFC